MEPLRILVVDDMPEGTLWERFALEPLGAVITFSQGVSEMFSHLAQSAFDIVLLDLNIPPEFPTARTVAEIVPRVSKMARVLVLTGMADETLSARCKLRGAMGFMHKLEAARNPQKLRDLILSIVAMPAPEPTN